MALVCKLNRALFLINHKQKVICNEVHLLVVVLHIEVLCVKENLLDARLTQIFYERIVFRQSLVRTQQNLSTLFLVSCSNKPLCLIEQLGYI